jgi:hypothetical protein
VLSRFFSLLLLLLPTAAFSTIMAKRKPRLKSWKLEPNPKAIREGPTERKTALETTGSTIRRLRGIRVDLNDGGIKGYKALDIHSPSAPCC